MALDRALSPRSRDYSLPRMSVMRTILKTILLGVGQPFLPQPKPTEKPSRALPRAVRSVRPVGQAQVVTHFSRVGAEFCHSDTDAKQMQCSHGGCLGTHPISISPFSISPGPLRIEVVVIASDRLPTQLDIYVLKPHQFTATTHQGTTNDGTGFVVILTGFCTGDFRDYAQQSN